MKIETYQKLILTPENEISEITKQVYKAIMLVLGLQESWQEVQRQFLDIKRFIKKLIQVDEITEDISKRLRSEYYSLKD